MRLRVDCDPGVQQQQQQQHKCSDNDDADVIVAPGSCDSGQSSKSEMIKTQVTRAQDGLSDNIKFKGTVDGLIKGGEIAQGKCNDKSNNSHEKIFRQLEKSKGVDGGSKNSDKGIKYYGELKGYDQFKTSASHEKSHNVHAKSKLVNVEPSSKSVYSDKYSDSYDGKHAFYHRSSAHAKPNVFQVYQETKYSYNVSGVPGTPAQASAAAAFFAR